MKLRVLAIFLFITTTLLSSFSQVQKGMRHTVGEELEEGVIFYLFIGEDGKEHGLVVSKEEQINTRWQNAPSLVNANSMTDGEENTNLMTRSPARAYVESLGEGWYLPSINELSLLWMSREEANVTLNIVGKPISKTTHWSSTEYVDLSALDFDFDHGYSGGVSLKTHHFTVRAVKKF